MCSTHFSLGGTFISAVITSFLRLSVRFSDPSDISQNDLRTRRFLRGITPKGSAPGQLLPAVSGFGHCLGLPGAAVMGHGQQSHCCVRRLIAAGELRDINPFEMALLILAV